MISSSCSYFFIFLPFRKEAEELGINLIDDVTKLLGVVLEVEIIYFYDEYIPFIFVHDEIFVKVVDTFQIINWHLLFIV